MCTLHGLPVGWALTGAKADERQVLADILTGTPALADTDRTRLTLIGDKNYYGQDFHADLGPGRRPPGAAAVVPSAPPHPGHD